MKVKELVAKYNENQRINITKELDVQEYTSISLKREMAKLVVDSCTSMVDGEVRVDSVERYILFTIAVLGMHTNLEFTGDDDGYSVLDDYDALCESGLLLKIIDTFKEDYLACQEILNMVTSDRMQDIITLQKKVNMCLDDVVHIIESLLNGLVENLNISDIEGIINANGGNLIDLYNMLKPQ